MNIILLNIKNVGHLRVKYPVVPRKGEFININEDLIQKNLLSGQKLLAEGVWEIVKITYCFNPNDKSSPIVELLLE